jgi:hypothetical protein
MRRELHHRVEKLGFAHLTISSFAPPDWVFSNDGRKDDGFAAFCVRFVRHQ